MPLSLKSLASNAEELERQAAAVRAQEAEARAAAELEAKAEQARRKQAQRDATARLATLERETEATIAEAAQVAGDAPLPEHHTRVLARALLLGNLRGGDEQGGPHGLVLARDEAAGLLFAQSQAAAGLLTAMASHGLDGEPMARADALECRCWAAFMRRLRTLAGEV
jgi:hypothetical protein